MPLNNDFIIEVASTLEHAIWQLWHGKVRATDAQGGQKHEAIFHLKTNL